MKKVILVFLVLSMFSFGSAFQANVTIIDDIGSFSGAYLKIKSVDSDVFIDDKIYPSEFLTSVGIVKFNLEISLSEIDLNVRLINNGAVISDFESGPYSINGSDILIDLREKVEVVEEVVDSNVSEIDLVNDEELFLDENDSVMVVENESLEDKKYSVFLTGLAIFYNEDSSLNLGYSIVGGAVFLLLLVLVLTMVFRRSKIRGVTMNEDEKELEYMEKKVKETEEKIAKIKDGKARKNKIEKAKAKLAQENAELKELENEGNGEKIEKQEKVVDKAEDEVEKIEDE